MRAGKLKERVLIQRKVKGTNGVEETFTWSDVTTVYAEVRPVAGREFFQRDRTVAEVDTEIHMRYRQALAITPEDRLVCRGVQYNIHAVINERMEDKRTICMCKSGTNDGS